MGAADHIAIQRAVFDALCAHAPLMALLPDGLGGVGTFMPSDRSLPCVVIESTVSQPLCTQADALDDCSVTCVVYGDQPASTQVRGIVHEVARALQAPLSVDGYHIVLQQGGNMQAQATGGGARYRASYDLRMIIEKQEA